VARVAATCVNVSPARNENAHKASRIDGFAAKADVKNGSSRVSPAAAAVMNFPSASEFA